MNINQVRMSRTVTPPHPVAYAQRRISSLIVSGAALAGIVSAAAVEAAGLGPEWSLAIGSAAFIVLSMILTSLESRRSPAAGEALAAVSVPSTQLRRDPEKVTGRATGARG
jgi:hypothetical protein